MRTKLQIIKSYLILINKEKGLNYSKEKIEELLSSEDEIEALSKLIDDELYSLEEVFIKSETGRFMLDVSTIRSFYIFCKCIIYRDIRSGRFIWNSFVKKQFLIVEHNGQTCYMAHRGSGKSFFLVLYSIFKMYLIDYFDVCYCSNVPKQKKRWMRIFRSVIDNNEFLMEKKDIKGVRSKESPWGQEEIEYNYGILEGTTVGTTPRGGHYNLAIGDDPLREDKKYTDEFIVDYFQGILKPTTYTKKARYVIVGTPQHNEDLFHTLMNDKLDKNNRPIGNLISNGQIGSAGFYSETFPAIIDEKNKIVLVPEIWDYERLMIEKGRIGDIRFNREMMCRCITFKNSLIGSSLFKSCCDDKMQLIQQGEKDKKYMIIVDSATSDAPTADFCAMSVFEDSETKFILRHLFHEKGYPITDPDGLDEDQIHKLYELWKSFNKPLIVIERNNAGIALIQGMKSLCSKNDEVVEIIEHFTHTTSTGKINKTVGKSEDVVNYIEEGLKNHIVVFPCDPEDIYTIDSFEKVKTEHLNFGVKKGRGGEIYEAIAGHDDIFDTCYLGFKFRGDQGSTLPMAITMPGET